ncbi:MAG: hypothetical protein HRU19_31225 [Pseudobacteriovorax sp.]|nr:hypothetical protein [Pseudobacteriovorax sp.]
MFKQIAFAALVLAPTVSYSASTNVTDEFYEFVEERMVGKDSTGDKRYDYRRNGFGEVVHGTAKGRITDLASTSGRGFVYRYDDDIWGGEERRVEIGIDSSFIFRYRGSSEGRTQCYVPGGNSFCGMKWGSVNPEGRIILDVNANDGDGYIIHVKYEVLSDADSRAAEVTKIAMQNLKPYAVEVIQNFVRRYKQNARFVVAE